MVKGIPSLLTALVVGAPWAAAEWDKESWPAGGAKSLVQLQSGAILTSRTIKLAGGVAVICSRSLDGGRTWNDAGTIAQDEAGADIGDGHLLARADGEVWFSYRDNKYRGLHAARPEYSIRVAVSRDEGRTWSPHSVVEAVALETGANPSRGLWSSFLLERRDGVVQCYYDDENAPFIAGLPRHQWTRMKTWDAARKEWGGPVTVSRAHDPAQLSRDGMPSVVELPDGRLICAVESCQVAPPHANLIRYVTSDDGGATWSWQRAERSVLYQPARRDFMALAPQMIRLADGRLLCVFATDEDRGTPDRPGTPPPQLNMDIKCVLSSDGGRTWTTPAQTVDSSSHRDYAPGVLALRQGPDIGTLLAVWWEAGRDFRAKQGRLAPLATPPGP